jgi:hypothetical protein
MNAVLIILRLVHIFAGVFWVGAAFVLFFFIAPAARDLAPESQRFLQNLMGRRRLSVALGVASLLTVLAGAALYGIDSGGFRWSWISSGVGLGFTLGALAALGSLVLGATILGPTSRRMGALAAELNHNPGPPPAGAAAEMERLNARMAAAGRVNILLLAIALLSMATARYWVF